MNKKQKIWASIAGLAVIMAGICIALAVHAGHQRDARALQSTLVSDEAISPADQNPVAAAIPAAHRKTSGNNATTEAAQSPSILDGTAYQLASVDGKALSTGQNDTITFNNGMLSAKFCNSMSGAFTLSGGTIKANLVSTMMACSTPAGIMDSESAFTRILGAGAHLVMENNSLALSGSDGTEMSFVRIFAQ